MYFTHLRIDNMTRIWYTDYSRKVRVGKTKIKYIVVETFPSCPKHLFTTFLFEQVFFSADRKGDCQITQTEMRYKGRTTAPALFTTDPFIFMERNLTMTELKPCRYCKSEAETRQLGHFGNHYVSCTKCNNQTNGYDTEEAAVACWNALQEQQVKKD